MRKRGTSNEEADVTLNLMPISKEARTVCVLYGSGLVCNVTLHQSNSVGETLAYEV